MASPNTWTFTPFPALPSTLLPNILFYNATNPSLNNLTYQISISYPFEWGSLSSPTPNTTKPPAVKKTALTTYLIDGNALGLTASEAYKRRKPVDSAQPDAVVVSIGYPLSDAVYDLARRRVDFRPPAPRGDDDPGEVSGAEAFLGFISGVVRPWVRGQVTEEVWGGRGVVVEWGRDMLYGHSFGGLFVVWALLREWRGWDTFLVGSPGLWWNNGSIFGEVSRVFGTGLDSMGKEGEGVVFEGNGTKGGEGGVACSGDGRGPAVFIGYGELEQFPVRRRTETEAEFQARRNFLQPLGMTEGCHDLFNLLKGSGKMRDVKLKEYIGQDHSGVAASLLTDGIDYFVDW